MATGGSVSYSTTPEVVQIFGRVSTTQTKVAPANSGKWTVADGGTGIFNITFTEQYSEFLGCVVTIESATASAVAVVASWTASTRVLVINTFTTSTGSALDDVAFAFIATFDENKAP